MAKAKAGRLQIVVGTYEGALVGQLLYKHEDDYKLLDIFCDNSNRGSIRCVAVLQHRMVASGGVDDMIHIYNLENHTPIRMLTNHSASVTSLEFFRASELFSTSEDKTFCAWRLSDWEPRTFRGHKAVVNCVSVHPTGKLALTVSSDKTMKTWNLVDGRPAFTSNIKQTAELVLWSPDGSNFLIAHEKKIDIYSVETGTVLKSIYSHQKVNSIVFVSDIIFVYSGEGEMQSTGRMNASLCFVNTNGTELCNTETQSTRIRGLAVSPSHEQPDSAERWLSSAASDGTISVYRLNIDETTVKVELIASKVLPFRPTCIAVTRPMDSTLQSKKRKRKKKQMVPENKDGRSPESEKVERQMIKKAKFSDGKSSPKADTAKKNLKKRKDSQKSPEVRNVVKRAKFSDKSKKDWGKEKGARTSSNVKNAKLDKRKKL